MAGFELSTEVLGIQRRNSVPRVLSLDEGRRFLNACDTLDRRRSSPRRELVLLYLTGLRAGEGLRLTLADVDLQTAVLRIRDTKYGTRRCTPRFPTCFAEAVRYRQSMRTPATFDNAAETARRRLENDQWAPATLLPTEAFSDQPASETAFRRLCAPDTARGRDAWAVHRRIMSSCAGWRERPTAAEFYDAIRANEPTGRQRAIIRMWGAEATLEDLIEAWAQRAYTFRQLVRALHRVGFNRGSRIRTINRWARRF